MDPRPNAAAPLLSTVADSEAELPEAELEDGVTELVPFDGTSEELAIAVAEEVEEAVVDDVDVVFVVLEESKSDSSMVATE